MTDWGMSDDDRFDLDIDRCFAATFGFQPTWRNTSVPPDAWPTERNPFATLREDPNCEESES